jgi:hypothetical protein
VLFEGNFRPDTHAELLARLFALDDVDVRAVYLDVPLTETLRRHETRRQIITIEKMAELHPVAVPLGVPGEVIVPETSSLEDTVEVVLGLLA